MGNGHIIHDRMCYGMYCMGYAPRFLGNNKATRGYLTQHVGGSGSAKAAFLEEITPTLNLKGRQVGGRRRVGQQRMRWLDSIIDSMDLSLSKL